MFIYFMVKNFLQMNFLMNRPTGLLPFNIQIITANTNLIHAHTRNPHRPNGLSAL